LVISPIILYHLSNISLFLFSLLFLLHNYVVTAVVMCFLYHYYFYSNLRFNNYFYFAFPCKQGRHLFFLIVISISYIFIVCYTFWFLPAFKLVEFSFFVISTYFASALTTSIFQVWKLIKAVVENITTPRLGNRILYQS